MLVDFTSKLMSATVALLVEQRKALRRGIPERAQSHIIWTVVGSKVPHKEIPPVRGL